MDLTVILEQLRAALGLDEPHAVQMVARAVQILVVAALAMLIAQWVSEVFRRAEKSSRMDTEIAALTSCAAALGLNVLGLAFIHAILGANWTAIAALLGAAAFGISLALQTVGMLDLPRYSVTGIPLPIDEIQSAVIASRRGTRRLWHGAPVLTFAQATPDGTDVQMTVEHDLGQRVDEPVISRLRLLFPEATIATSSAASAW